MTKYKTDVIIYELRLRKTKTKLKKLLTSDETSDIMNELLTTVKRTAKVQKRTLITEQ